VNTDVECESQEGPQWVPHRGQHVHVEKHHGHSKLRGSGVDGIAKREVTVQDGSVAREETI
jgi:hypothetical protein